MAWAVCVIVCVIVSVIVSVVVSVVVGMIVGVIVGVIVSMSVVMAFAFFVIVIVAGALLATQMVVTLTAMQDFHLNEIEDEGDDSDS